jgi:hypothetical protein
VTSPIQDVFLETAASWQYSSVLTPAAQVAMSWFFPEVYPSCTAQQLCIFIRWHVKKNFFLSFFSFPFLYRVPW